MTLLFSLAQCNGSSIDSPTTPCAAAAQQQIPIIFVLAFGLDRWGRRTSQPPRCSPDGVATAGGVGIRCSMSIMVGKRQCLFPVALRPPGIIVRG
jgi:hypothetical protein